MKKLLFLFLSFFIFSCEPAPDTKQAVYTTPSKEPTLLIINNHQLYYFQDPKTHLCFAALNTTSYGGNEVTSITCIPCDSLKNVPLN